MATRTWEKTETGYRMTDGSAELVKGPKGWTLVAQGRSVQMSKSVSFGHAEKQLQLIEGAH